MSNGIATKVKPQTPKPKYNSKLVWLTEDGSILGQKELQLFDAPPPGHQFHSTLEAIYYRDVLRPMEKAGLIRVELQPRYEVLSGFTVDGEKFLPVHYLPDFAVTYADGRIEVIDVKGFTTDVFALKRKMFLYRYRNVRLNVLKHVRKFGGWLTVEEYKAAKRQERRARK